MASTREKESLLQQCQRAAHLGSSISTQMTEFIGQVKPKQQPRGFRDLGLEFLEVCRIITSIEVGLTEFLKAATQFPPDVLAELEKKFSQTVEDFLALSRLLQKLFEHKRPGTVAKLQQVWAMVFADKDIAKIQNSLRMNRDALKMSMLVFSWVPQDQNVLVAPEYLKLAADLGGEGDVPEVSSQPELEDTSLKDDELPELDDTSIQSPGFAGVVEITRELQDPKRLVFEEEVKKQDTNSEAIDVEPKTLVQPELTVRPKLSVARIKADPARMKRRHPSNPSSSNPASLQKALLLAVEGKKHKVVEQLLDRGVSPNTTPKVALIEAAARGDLATMQLLLEFGADPNFADPERESTPLIATAEQNRNFVDGTRLLLSYGADPAISRRDGFTPLGLAVWWKRIAQATLLLEYGADLEVEIPRELSLLGMAVAGNAVDMIRLLLGHGADPSRKFTHGGSTPLIATVEQSRNFVEAMAVLLEHGARPNERRPDGFSPLSLAVYWNKPAQVSLLLKYGADPNLPPPESPLSWAYGKPEIFMQLVDSGVKLERHKGLLENSVAAKSKEVVEYLLEKKLDPNEKNSEGLTPLTTAIRDNQLELVEILLSHGADPNLKGEWLPLSGAVKNPQLLKCLLESGAKVQGNEWLVEAAVDAKQLESVKLLVGAGLGVNTPGRTLPLVSAVVKATDNDTEMISYLLDHGADINLKFDGKRNALLEAISLNHTEVVRLFLNTGRVNLEVQDQQGRSPLDLAAEQGNDELVGIFLDLM